MEHLLPNMYHTIPSYITICCYILNIYVPQNSYVEILIPNVMVLGGGAFGISLGHEGGAIMNN